MRILYIVHLAFLLATSASAQPRYLRAVEKSDNNRWQFISYNLNTGVKQILTDLPDSINPFASAFDAKLQRYYLIVETSEGVRRLISINAFSGDIISNVESEGLAGGISVGMSNKLYGFKYISGSGTKAVSINPTSGQTSNLFSIGDYYIAYMPQSSSAHPSKPYYYIFGTGYEQGKKILTALNLTPPRTSQFVDMDNSNYRTLCGNEIDGFFYGIRIVNPYDTSKRIELYKQQPEIPDSFIVINTSMSLENIDQSQSTIIAASNEMFCRGKSQAGTLGLASINLADGSINKFYDIPESIKCQQATMYAPDLSTNRISGLIYLDKNANGQRDTDDPPLMNEWVQVEPGGFSLGSGLDGRYSMPLPQGSYTVKVKPSRLFSVTSDSSEYHLTFSGKGEEKNNLDFGLTTKQAFEGYETVLLTLNCAVQVIGFQTEQTILVQNQGITAVSGTLSYQINGELEFVSSTPAPASSGNGMFEYPITNLIPGQSIRLKIVWKVPPRPDLIGKTTNINISLNALSQSGKVFQLHDDCSKIIRGAFDPNDKLVNDAYSADIAPGDTLNYLIRFQNVGNDTAHKVVVRDTLSANLIADSFIMRMASHDYTFYRQNNIIVWEFDNIMLPDSGTDMEGSNGFIKFDIVASNQLNKGQSISNTASIYFDYNPPVLTNHAIATYPLAMENIVSNDLLTISPQPANNTVRISGKDFNYDFISVIDITGKLWIKSAISQSDSSLIVSTTDLPVGFYFIKLTKQSTGVEQILKMVISR